MNTILLTLSIILRATIRTKLYSELSKLSWINPRTVFSLSPDYIYTVLANILFGAFMLNYLTTKTKNKLVTTLYVAIITFSMFWDFQPLLHTVLIMVMLVFGLSMERTQSPKPEHNDNDKSKNKKLTPVLIGTILSIFIIAILAQLDPNFKYIISKAFQNINTFIKEIYLSTMYYLGKSILFILIPTVISYLSKLNTILSSLTSRMLNKQKLASWITTLVIMIVISYGIYDTYILSKVFLVKVFHTPPTPTTIGKSTQLSYIEMVSLGSTLLFLISWTLQKIIDLGLKTSKTTKALFSTSIFLIIPTLNILRILMLHYIPQYGLSIKRVFGIYTVIGFVFSFIYTYIEFKKNNSKILQNTAISLVFSVALLSFAIPNNIIVTISQINRPDIDMKYIRKLNISKSGRMLYPFINNSTTLSSDEKTMLNLMVASKTKDIKKTDEYANKFIKDIIERNIQEMNDTLSTKDYYYFVSKYTQKGNYKSYKRPYTTNNQKIMNATNCRIEYEKNQKLYKEYKSQLIYSIISDRSFIVSLMPTPRLTIVCTVTIEKTLIIPKPQPQPQSPTQPHQYQPTTETITTTLKTPLFTELKYDTKSKSITITLTGKPNFQRAINKLTPIR